AEDGIRVFPVPGVQTCALPIYSARKTRRESYAFEYPEEQWYPPDAFRGRPVLVEEQGRPRCVACGLCARSCPPLAISMQAHEVRSEERRVGLLCTARWMASRLR